MHDFGRINAIYAQYFDEETAPARELVEVANLPKFVNIEISIIAAVGA
jgi:2-iminobutanoate/2-iminopropanoate deaminase